MNKNVAATISNNDPHGAECKVKTIGLEHTKLIKFHCLRLMAKYISKVMVMTD